MRESLQIRDRAPATVLAKPRQRKILLSLVAGERSLSQLSRLTGTPLNLLHHHVQKLLKLGLARVVRVEARAGAPIKHYRATARAFYVPTEFLDADPGAALASQLRETLARSLARSVQGVLYSHDGKGPAMRLVKDPDPRRMALELWLELKLAQADAAALAAELRALLQRFQGRSQKAQRRFLIHAALASAG